MQEESRMISYVNLHHHQIFNLPEPPGFEHVGGRRYYYNTAAIWLPREEGTLILDEIADHHHVPESRKKETILRNLNTRRMAETTEEEENNNDDICVVCQEGLRNHGVELPCKHEYHADCIAEWLKWKSVCPLCKATVKI